MEHMYIRSKLSPETGAALRRARKARGLTLDKAGAQAGISEPYLCQIEHALRCPSVAVAGALAKAYRLPTDETVNLMSEAVRNAGNDRPGKRNAAAKAAAN